MDDLTTYALLTTSFFFVALAIALLVRYRQVSQTINASTDLGRDLWSSLEQRLRKQDERILDMMGRMEVIQSRVVVAAAAQTPVSLAPLLPRMPAAAPEGVKATPATEPAPLMQQPESQPSQESQAAPTVPKSETKLDETQLAALTLLIDGSKTAPLLKDSLKKSREHTARLMKELFEMGLVRRDDSSKPFVYQLTDKGREYLQP